MRCPACRQSITETEPACLQCGFSLAALASQMGIAPQLTRPVADVDNVLSATERRTMTKAVQQLEQRFPDISGVVVITEIPANLTPEIYAFWLFNRTSLFSEVEKGGNNHGMLLLLDAMSPRAAVMIGYGLEPLLPETTLELCLRPLAASLLNGKRTAAVEAFFRELERQLTTLAETWPQIFGYTESAPWFESGTGEMKMATQVSNTDPY
jgi:uncharacterized membrane protein YgcG